MLVLSASPQRLDLSLGHCRIGYSFALRLTMRRRKNPAAVALGRKGGKARAATMSPTARSEACRRAVQARWARVRARAQKPDTGIATPPVGKAAVSPT